MSVQLRSKILNRFQIAGFTLRSDASRFLLESLIPLEEERQEAWLRRLLSWLQAQRLDGGPFLGKEDLLGCIRNCERATDDGTDTRLLVADAFALQALTYCQERHKFVPRQAAGHSGAPRLFGDAGAKAFFFRERYRLVLEKTSRHQCFSSRRCLPGSTGGFDLQPIEHLLGTTGERVVVLGLLCQLEEGKYFLEDMTGFVQLDTSGTKFTADLFVENSFVLAEGRCDDAVFRVDAMGLPPIEPATETLCCRACGCFLLASPRAHLPASCWQGIFCLTPQDSRETGCCSELLGADSYRRLGRSTAPRWPNPDQAGLSVAFPFTGPHLFSRGRGLPGTGGHAGRLPTSGEALAVHFRPRTQGSRNLQRAAQAGSPVPGYRATWCISVRPVPLGQQPMPAAVLRPPGGSVAPGWAGQGMPPLGPPALGQGHGSDVHALSGRQRAPEPPVARGHSSLLGVGLCPMAAPAAGCSRMPGHLRCLHRRACWMHLLQPWPLRKDGLWLQGVLPGFQEG
ncbi:DNA polymerase epsilon subunit 2 isoform X2 [Amblyomma americanum]